MDLTFDSRSAPGVVYITFPGKTIHFSSKWMPLVAILKTQTHSSRLYKEDFCISSFIVYELACCSGSINRPMLDRMKENALFMVHLAPNFPIIFLLQNDHNGDFLPPECRSAVTTRKAAMIRGGERKKECALMGASTLVLIKKTVRF